MVCIFNKKWTESQKSIACQNLNFPLFREEIMQDLLQMLKPGCNKCYFELDVL